MVLYGGVSLAVYIYGVVVEAQRLLRATDELERADGPEFSAEKLTPYARALYEAGVSSVMIDLLSGTSAGGINGILLAKALARGSDLESVKNLWLDCGDIAQLLQPPSSPNPHSLLQSREFERHLREGMEQLDKGKPGVAPPPVLDLFVSSTHLRGGRRTFHDSLDQPIPTRQHRYVFQRKLRTLREGPGGEAQGYRADDFLRNEPLVKIARATSAFPFAFEPVEIKQEDGLLPEGEADGWFADGGILNNKPFTEAVETIVSRSSDRPVRRWLFSIDPDPAPPAWEDGSAGEMPPVDQIAVRSITTIPRYQSIVRDLLALDQHNQKVGAAERTIYEGEVELASAGRLRRTEFLGPGVSAAYEAMRRQAWGVEIADRLLDAAVVEGPQGLDTAGVHREFRFAAEAAFPDGPADGARHRRRLYYLIKLIAMSVDGDAEAAKQVLWAEYETLSNLLWEELTRVPLELEPNDQRGSAALLAIPRIARTVEVLPAVIAASMERLERRLDGVDVYVAPRQPPPGQSEPAAGIAPPARVDPVRVSLGQAAERFRPRDAMLLAAEVYGGLRQRDRIEHAQISPAGGRNTGVGSADKLAGTTLGHFGGFLDRGWRRNDLMWGRLDGAEALIRAVLRDDPDGRAETLIDKVQLAIVEAERPELLSGSGDWKADLRRYAGGDISEGELNGPRLVSLGLRAAAVVRKMLRSASDGSAEGIGGRGRAFLLRSVANVLGFSLALVYLPATALFTKGHLLRRGAVLLALLPLLWGVLTLVLGCLGVVPLSEVTVPALAAIGFYPLFLLVYWGLATLTWKVERLFRRIRWAKRR
jgi:hypothetical protein